MLRFNQFKINDLIFIHNFIGGYMWYLRWIQDNPYLDTFSTSVSLGINDLLQRGIAKEKALEIWTDLKKNPELSIANPKLIWEDPEDIC